jgi:hypothetical protein
MRDNMITTPYALIKAGIAYEEAGAFDDAKSAYEELQSNYTASRFANKVETRIARVEAKLSAE